MLSSSKGKQKVAAGRDFRKVWCWVLAPFGNTVKTLRSLLWVTVWLFMWMEEWMFDRKHFEACLNTSLEGAAPEPPRLVLNCHHIVVGLTPGGPELKSPYLKAQPGVRLWVFNLWFLHVFLEKPTAKTWDHKDTQCCEDGAVVEDLNDPTLTTVTQ